MPRRIYQFEGDSLPPDLGTDLSGLPGIFSVTVLQRISGQGKRDVIQVATTDMLANDWDATYALTEYLRALHQEGVYDLLSIFDEQHTLSVGRGGL